MNLHIDLTDLLIRIILIVLPVIAAFLTYWARNLYHLKKEEIKQRIGERLFNLLQDIAEAAVRAAEQAGIVAQIKTQIKLTGEEKLNLALGYAQQYANDAGIPIDVERLRVAIEGQVHALNDTPPANIQINPTPVPPGDTVDALIKELQARGLVINK